MAIIRIHTGSDGKSHFQEIVPKFESREDKSETAELIPGSGMRRDARGSAEGRSCSSRVSIASNNSPASA